MKSKVTNAIQQDLSTSRFYRAFEDTEYFVKKSASGVALSNILSIDLFEEMIWLAYRLSPTCVQISKDSTLLNEKEKKSLDVVRHLGKLLDESYSIVLNFAEKFNSKIALFSREFGFLFDSPTHFAIFLTPPGTNTFKPHYDAIDVFAIQIAGKKTWKIGEVSTVLPLDANTYAEGPNPTFKEKYILNKCDLLYVPRGLTHSVVTHEEYSLHASIALDSSRFSELLLEAIRLNEENDIRLRKSTKIEYLFDKKDIDCPELKSINFQKIFNSRTLKRSNSRIKARHWSSMPQLPGRLHKKLNHDNDLTEKTLLEKREGMPSEVLFLYENGGRSAISFPGLGVGRIDKNKGLLTFPGKYIVPLESISNMKSRFSVIDIKGNISIKAKIALATRLLNEGFLEIVYKDASIK